MAKGSILVVDDEEGVRGMLQHVLMAAGHHVVSVSNGREAVQQLSKEKFDVVLTDLLMPEKDGTEVIVEVRRKHPNVKIVAMTGGGHIPQEEYLKIARGFGAQALLAKPFETRELLSTVASLLPPDMN